MRYFTIMCGLAGCYLPDNAYTVAVATRRDLSAALSWERASLVDAGFIGASKANFTSLAAAAWRDGRSVLPLAPAHARRNYCHAIEVTRVSRAEYLEAQREGL